MNRPRFLRSFVLSFCLTLPAIAADPQAVSFTTYDGQTIHADYYPRKGDESGAPIAILLHMYRSDRTAFAPLIDPLHRAGFAVLALDLRGHGDSATNETRSLVEIGDTAFFRSMTDDVRAAYNWLAEQPGVDRSRFALVGASIGASIAIEYAADDKSVDALVLLSPGTDYLGLNSETPLRSIKGRQILMLAADNGKEKEALKTLKAAAPGADADVVKGDYHGTHMFGKTPDIEQRIANYLKHNVGVPSRYLVYGSIRSNIYHLPGSGWIDEISPWNLRVYSSPQEAESRGLRRAKNNGPNDRKTKRKNP